jgi:hypothetical protein
VPWHRDTHAPRVRTAQGRHGPVDSDVSGQGRRPIFLAWIFFPSEVRAGHAFFPGHALSPGGGACFLPALRSLF